MAPCNYEYRFICFRCRHAKLGLDSFILQLKEHAWGPGLPPKLLKENKRAFSVDGLAFFPWPSFLHLPLYTSHPPFYTLKTVLYISTIWWHFGTISYCKDRRDWNSDALLASYGLLQINIFTETIKTTTEVNFAD